MARVLARLLTLLLATALTLAPVVGAGMGHAGHGADMAAPGHCPEQGLSSTSEPLSSGLVEQAEPSVCEAPCAVCGICGVSALPSSATLPLTASLSGPVSGAVAMGLGARAGPDLRPPL